MPQLGINPPRIFRSELDFLPTPIPLNTEGSEPASWLSLESISGSSDRRVESLPRHPPMKIRQKTGPRLLIRRLAELSVNCVHQSKGTACSDGRLGSERQKSRAISHLTDHRSGALCPKRKQKGELRQKSFSSLSRTSLKRPLATEVRLIGLLLFCSSCNAFRSLLLLLRLYAQLRPFTLSPLRAKPAPKRGFRMVRHGSDISGTCFPSRTEDCLSPQSGLLTPTA